MSFHVTFARSTTAAIPLPAAPPCIVVARREHRCGVSRRAQNGAMAAVIALCLLLAFGGMARATTVTVLLSADSYGGSPVATVTADGNPITTLTVTALHGRASQPVSFDLPAGDHRITLAASNVAYAGRTDQNRTLYLDGVTLGGAPLPVSPTPFLFNGAVDFGVTVAAPLAPPGTFVIPSGSGSVGGNSGTNGVNGTNGTNGVGIASAAVNGVGHLVLTKTDGTTTDAGYVVGPAGTNGTNGAGGLTAFSASTYTTSGAINLTDTLSILNGASGTVAMTLANGTTDGQPVLVKLLGAANATLTANIDGSPANVVALTASGSGTLKDSLKLKWSTLLSTWLAE